MTGHAAPRILVVEDEPLLALGIRENLEAEGNAVEVVHDGLVALDRLRAARFDLVVLDVMLPGMDGYTLCETMRDDGDRTPVLFLTARGAPDDRVRGLEAGGDDYLAKPFHLRELLLRVAAILRRGSWYQVMPPAGSEVRFGDNAVDFRTYRAVSWDGREHALTQKEAMILKALAERAGEVVSREDILEKVWGYEVFPSTRTVDNFIVRMRKRFEPDPENPRFIHTVRGVGYRLTVTPEDPR